MAARPRKAQPRSLRIGLAVTEEERTALVRVAAARGIRDFSTLLRSMSLNAVVKEYTRLHRVFNSDAGKAPASEVGRLPRAA